MNLTVGKKGEVRVVPVVTDQVTKGLEELYQYLKEKEIFRGARGEIFSDIGYRGSNAILVGLGEEAEVDSEKLKLAFYKAGKALAKARITEATVELPRFSGLCYRRTAMAAAEGLMNSAYAFDKYVTSEKKNSVLTEVGFLVEKGKEEKISQALTEIGNIMKGVELTRDLVNEPAEVIYPETLAKAAKEALEPLGVEVEILGRDEIGALGMTALLAVARGSAREPRLIVMRYKGGSEGEEVLGLVGKGLTYDSGGYALKTPAGMATMHIDMGGGGAVIGAMAALAANKVERNVTAVVAACENMISGDSFKNGDIIPTMSGKTIEVGNTDAEGRVTLADSIYYTATRENAAEIIDVATLTGAAVVALGTHYTAAITNDQAMADDVLKAARMAGEKVWQLPADDEFRDMVKGKRADLLNSVKGGAGTITAGMFLEHFTDGKKWVHLDIAGTVAGDAPKGYRPAGATGIPVKTLYYYCKGDLDSKHSLV